MQNVQGNSNISSIAHILGMEGAAVRVQNPSVRQTEGDNPRWWIKPYVDSFDENGRPIRVQIPIYLGHVATMTKREAIAEKNAKMAVINRGRVVLQAQLKFGALLDHYLEQYVRRPEQLSYSTQQKYEAHIKNHIRPTFGKMALGEIRGLEIDRWLGGLAKPRVQGEVDTAPVKVRAGLSWNTRTDLRNILSGVFTKARQWGLWVESNPCEFVNAGRRREARPQRKLTIDQTRLFLDALPVDVCQICEVALYCTLRISEALGLTWRYVDFTRGLILVRQRFYRGDLDTVKTRRAERDVPLGDMALELAERYPGPGHEDEFVFSVQTYVGHDKKPRVCRDDRDINEHFLRKTAKQLGLYWPGFGFHSFRREALTEHGKTIGSLQAQRMAGHATSSMTLEYTLADQQAQERAVRELQARVRGTVVPIRREA